MGYWVVIKISEAGRNENYFFVLKQQLDTVRFLSDVSLTIKLCNLVGALLKIKSLRFVGSASFEHLRRTGNQLIYSMRRGREYSSIIYKRKRGTKYMCL